MTRIEAVNTLYADGWNYYGADAIVSEFTDDELAHMSRDVLLAVSEDYKDR